MRRIAWLVLLAGCASAPEEIPDEDFAYWGARALCERTRECQRGAFDASYFSMADCRAHLELLLQETYDLYETLDCDYRAAKAGDAYRDIMEMSCEDFYEGDYNESTAEIWDECLGGGLGSWTQ